MSKTENTPIAAIGSRISSIDVMRGLIIVFMVLDHVRERFYLHVPLSDPMDITTTPPSLYFSRYLAHLCAPMFVFLTGVSAWLYAHPAHKAYRSPTSFLAKRGLFLIFLEVTAVYLVWASSFNTFYLQVIWAIGLCMLVLSVLSKLNYWVIGFIGFTIVIGHNLLSPIHFEPSEWGYTLWTILHDRGFIIEDALFPVKVSYPVLPWIGVILVGYFAGPIYHHARSADNRKKLLVTLGLTCYACLLMLRGLNLYGETVEWQTQDSMLLTVMDFFNYTKYPPSLDYLLVTIGTGLLLLRLFESFDNGLTKALNVFGSVPMFVYLAHLYLLLVLYGVLYLLFGDNQGSRYGFDSIYMVWAVTILVPVLLYKPSKWFANYKHLEKRNKPWLTYF